MSINGKRDHITRQDLMAVAESDDLKKAGEVIQVVLEAAKKWPEFALEAGVGKDRIEAISKEHRLALA
jgi:hypothetical protein